MRPETSCIRYCAASTGCPWILTHAVRGGGFGIPVPARLDRRGLRRSCRVGRALHRNNPYAPSSSYSATKAGSDHLARASHRTYRLPVIVTSCSNNYGPRQFPEMLIPHMVLSALAGRPLPVYGDDTQVRDWPYVDDHARALCTVQPRKCRRDLQHRQTQRAAQHRRCSGHLCGAREAYAPRRRKHSAMRA